MIISFLVKLFAFYCLFILIRGALNMFQNYKLLKKAMEQGAQNSEHFEKRSTGRTHSSQSPDIVEAEFRVVDEEK